MKRFSIKNFRIFGSEGTELELKPVTILTGTNSSGKSSYVKALLLFKDYIDRMHNDYQKTGFFNPAAYTLDFTKAELKLKDFDNSLNRGAKEPVITFAMDIDLNNILGVYRVEYAFISGKDSRGLSIGILDSISVYCDDLLALTLCSEGKSLKIESIDIGNSLLVRFLFYEAFIVCPDQIIKSIEDNEALLQQCIIDDGIDLDKLGQTPEGQRLFSIQKAYNSDLKNPLFDVEDLYEFRHFENEEKVRMTDVFDSMDKTIEHNLLFYFPVLELFKGLNKKECINLLRGKVNCSSDIQELAPELNPIKSYSLLGKELDRIPLVEELIKDFESAEEDSFINYYRGLENAFLSTVPNHKLQPHSDKSYDFIKDSFLNDIELSFQNGRMGNPISSAFHRAYYVLSAWQWYEDKQNFKADKGSSFYSDGSVFLERHIEVEYSRTVYSGHRLFKLYTSYLEGILKNVLLPTDLTELTYFNESFTIVRRLHTFEENSLLTRTVTDFLEESKRTLSDKDNRFAGKREYNPGHFSSRWLKELGIGEKIIINTDSEGLGFKISVLDSDKNTESLADMGHGVTQIVQLLLLLEAQIMRRTCLLNREKNRLPFAETFPTSLKHHYVTSPIIVIEEPEVSLHPSMQSKLASMFVEAAQQYRLRFIIETHSEYLVRKTQSIISGMTEEEFKHNPFVVYYFNEDGSAYDLEYAPSGRFIKAFGSGFFDEASKSVLDILKRERRDKK